MTQKIRKKKKKNLEGNDPRQEILPEDEETSLDREDEGDL